MGERCEREREREGEGGGKGNIISRRRHVQSHTHTHIKWRFSTSNRKSSNREIDAVYSSGANEHRHHKYRSYVFAVVIGRCGSSIGVVTALIALLPIESLYLLVILVVVVVAHSHAILRHDVFIDLLLLLLLLDRALLLLVVRRT